MKIVSFLFAKKHIKSVNFVFCKVMAGSGHLQTFRLLRYLRTRSSAEGHMNYGLQMAVSYFEIDLGVGHLHRVCVSAFSPYFR
jgi:hypothetical protein